ncbi:MAG: glycosyltransferase family 4 protein [Bacteroidota bacterium]|nr:glycosyltransferase family 4 protein [Bacteroidota bacterium]MDP4234005.1 glycosyltransferase family 4 protein [Bacteroidota bacterium]MDP4242872.1 glycosyltransferase family 4 protein [Bacteroidota bacterium]MDP4287690.1 glycosyltransferase family 4 protein [Bacteroidota bacterium]
MNIDLLEPGAPPGLNVLVIAYYFPPMGLSGVQRTLKFVKYLTQFGWRPIVLTAGDAPYYAHDLSLMAEIQPLIDKGHIRIVRTAETGAPAPRLAKKDGKQLKLPSARWQRIRSKLLQTIYQPDSRIKWKKPALVAAEEIFKTERIDAMFTTAPPFTDFLIAHELRRRHHVPFLMDYRDPWVSNPVLNFYATPFHKAYARKLEDACLRSSNAITVASRRMKEVLLRDYNFLSHEDVAIVPHGYDPEDLRAASALVDKYRSPEKFRLTYGGAFYVGRSPIPMFEAAKLAIKREPAMGDDLELVFAGILQREYLRVAEKLGLTGNVRATGYLPHTEDLALLLSSDVLWMTMSDDLSAPGKLYEYLGTGKPILGLVPERSEAEKVIHDYGAGIAVKPKDIKAISDTLIELHRAWRKSTLPHNVNQPFVQSFDRQSLTKEMARQLGLMLRA